MKNKKDKFVSLITPTGDDHVLKDIFLTAGADKAARFITPPLETVIRNEHKKEIDLASSLKSMEDLNDYMSADHKIKSQISAEIIAFGLYDLPDMSDPGQCKLCLRFYVVGTDFELCDSCLKDIYNEIHKTEEA